MSAGQTAKTNQLKQMKLSDVKITTKGSTNYNGRFSTIAPKLSMVIDRLETKENRFLCFEVYDKSGNHLLSSFYLLDKGELEEVDLASHKGHTASTKDQFFFPRVVVELPREAASIDFYTGNLVEGKLVNNDEKTITKKVPKRLIK